LSALALGALQMKGVLKDVTASKAFFPSKTSKHWSNLSWANGKKNVWELFHPLHVSTKMYI